MNNKCLICEQPFGTGKDEKISQFAAYGGLPSPTCECCFEANDYSIKNREQLKFRSLQRRIRIGGNVVNIEVLEADWKSLEEGFALMKPA